MLIERNSTWIFRIFVREIRLRNVAAESIHNNGRGEGGGGEETYESLEQNSACSPLLLHMVDYIV